ncbi:MAG TPA: copper resistance system multicopper oxidase [Rhizomicrobium sp.]|nr:copper resistance system multicopper oxidase [Rhizomicrobium sp.]
MAASIAFRIALFALFLAAAPFAAEAGEYNLTIGDKPVEIDGHTVEAIAVNGQIPGPTLRFREGEDVVVHVTNTLKTTSSIHWHGMFVPAAMDGVPGLNGFPGIKPGETFTYRFTVRQSGTYWYHAHSGLQEQMGLYGPIVIDPKQPDPVQANRDYVVMLSDFPPEQATRILANLKANSDYYNWSRRTVGDFFHDAATKGVGETISDRLMWGKMRMDPTDLSDVSGYTFLVNGKPPEADETFLFKPGERVRLRIINGASMTYFDMKIPGLKMSVVAADGQDVVPVSVDELRISPAEIYDVIVEPKGAKAYTLFAQSLDRMGYARATLAPHDGMEAPIPPMYPRALLTMADMGMGGDVAGMDMSVMPGMVMDPPESKPSLHDDMKGMPGMDQPMPGMTMDDMSGMDMGATQATGWGSGYPAGEKVLSYADLKSLTPNSDARPPSREIVLHLIGNMQRYIWTIDGKPMDEADPIVVRYGERVKITFVNETMMAHPMHLHGMLLEVLNGQPPDRLPKKHIVNVPPGQTVSALLTANEPGAWAFHCHLLYHMASGMMTELVVTPEKTP